MKKPFRILTLDGGGSWAVIQALTLGRLYGEHTRGHDILRQVDMVAAGSTGSLILGALLCNKTPGEIVGSFESGELPKMLFPPLQDCEKNLLTVLGNFFRLAPRYSGSKKKENMGAFLGADGERFLSDFPDYVGHSSLRILIPQYDYLKNRVLWCRSIAGNVREGHPNEKFNLEEKKRSFDEIRLLDAVHGATQLPSPFYDNPATVFFYRDNRHIPRYVWDSTLAGFHNPVMAAVTEALALGFKPSDIIVTSLGTGAVVPLSLNDGDSVSLEKAFYFAENAQPSFKTNLSRCTNGLLQRPPDVVTSMASTLLGSGDKGASVRFFRFNPVIRGIKEGFSVRPPKDFTEKEFKRLMQLGPDVKRPADLSLVFRLAEAWMSASSEIPNQCLDCCEHDKYFLGHRTFAEALAGWRDVMQISKDLSASA